MLNSEQSKRLDHIDALRAVAVLLVIWTHYAERFAPLAGSQHVLDTLQRSVNFGRIGVVIFFGISGMLIPSSLRGAPGEGARRFLIRRFLRLYPAFWLSIPIACLMDWFLFGKQTSASQLIANVTMIPTAFGQDPVMAHYWTLETELYFYGLCLVLFWGGALQQMRYLYLLCVGLCGLFVVTLELKIIPAHALGQYKAMPYHLAIMLWGACFRLAHDTPLQTLCTIRWGSGTHARVQLTYRSAVGALTMLIVSIAILGAINDWRHNNMVHISSSLAYVFGIAIFTTLATLLKLRVRLFSQIGKISYSVYLFHGIPLYTASWLYQRYQLVGWPLSFYMIIPIIPLIALSWISYRFCEAPCVRLAHLLTVRRQSNARTPDDASGIVRKGAAPLHVRQPPA